MNTKIYVSTSVKCVETRVIDSETPKFVVYNGRREAKTSSYDGYFDTIEEAQQWIGEHYGAKILNAQRQLSYAKEGLASFKKILDNAR